MLTAKPCDCCQVQPVWNRWTERCFLCAFSALAMLMVLRLGWFIWLVSEFETPAPAFRPEKPAELPEARVVRQ